jgi:hypothetical protein
MQLRVKQARFPSFSCANRHEISLPSQVFNSAASPVPPPFPFLAVVLLQIQCTAAHKAGLFCSPSFGALPTRSTNGRNSALFSIRFLIALSGSLGTPSYSTLRTTTPRPVPKYSRAHFARQTAAASCRRLALFAREGGQRRLSPPRRACCFAPNTSSPHSIVSLCCRSSYRYLIKSDMLTGFMLPCALGSMISRIPHDSPGVFPLRPLLLPNRRPDQACYIPCTEQTTHSPDGHMAMTAVRIAATTDEKTATGGRTVTAATSAFTMT